MRITRGPGFGPQLRCLNFFHSSVPLSVLSYKWCAEKNGLMKDYILYNETWILSEGEMLVTELNNLN